MKIAFLFSGQGAQYPGMMKDLCEAEVLSKDVFDVADRTLGRSISEICFEGTQEDLNLTHNTQPCMLAGDLAAAAALTAHGIHAEGVAGFSLGEYAALIYAGAAPAEEIFKVVQIRADAMQEAVAPGKGAMAAFVGATSDKVEEVCAKVTKGYVVAANYNSPVQTVISGTTEGVDEACEIAKDMGINCMKLAVSAPFHCALMEPAAMRLKEEFEAVAFADTHIPVYMNVDAKPLTDSGLIPEKLVEQAMSPVRWVETLENMKADGFDTFIECGAGKTLSGLVKKTLKDVRIFRVENVKTLNDTLEGLKVD